MNYQLRELLTRIPPSPETDELQDFLTNVEKVRQAGFEAWWIWEGKDIENHKEACRIAWENGAYTQQTK